MVTSPPTHWSFSILADFLCMSSLLWLGSPVSKCPVKTMTLAAGTTLLPPLPLDVDPMSEAWHLEHVTAMRLLGRYGNQGRPSTKMSKGKRAQSGSLLSSPILTEPSTCLTQTSQRENGQFKPLAVSFPLLLTHIIPVSNGRWPPAESAKASDVVLVTCPPILVHSAWFCASSKLCFCLSSAATEQPRPELRHSCLKSISQPRARR